MIIGFIIIGIIIFAIVFLWKSSTTPSKPKIPPEKVAGNYGEKIATIIINCIRFPTFKYFLFFGNSIPQLSFNNQRNNTKETRRKHERNTKLCCVFHLRVVY